MTTDTLPTPNYRNKLEIADALNQDIRDVIEKNFPIAVSQTKEFAKQFKGKNDYDSAYKIWKFLKEHITYEKDDSDEQMVRLPSRFVHDGHGDCKSYASFAASILANLGMPVAFRYASYTNSQIPSHVYAVTKDENGKEIIIDGVWKYFNSEKKPRYKFDSVMKVYTLSGVEEDIGFSINLKKLAKQAKGAGKLFKKLGLSLPRRSYRTMVALNVHGMATKLDRMMKKDPNSVKRMWEKMGGKMSELLKSINAGKKKHHILGIEGIHGDIGVLPAVAAAIAAAAPIIVALAPILRKAGVDKEVPMVNAAGDPVIDPKTGKQMMQESSLDKIIDDAGAAADKLGLKKFNALEELDKGTADPEKGKNDAPGGFQLSPIVLIGGAGLLFLLLRKK